MLPIAINHITVPNLGYKDLFSLAADLGCVGVELRNDLNRPLFDHDQAADVGAAAKKNGLRILGLSQVYPFNDVSDEMLLKVKRLISEAKACGAETISLIPRNDGVGIGKTERIANLKLALEAITPLLESANMIALIEPLGFETSSLKSKEEIVEVIDNMAVSASYRLVHDTFHHALAGYGPIFPNYTGIVHVSGVVERNLAFSDMRDEHRLLVDDEDRLSNLAQLRALYDEGYQGPISFESFSPFIHQLKDPKTKIRESIQFLKTNINQ